jgi:tetratricopeptide (TPR) repeat protein
LKRLNLIIPIVTLVLVMSATGCGLINTKDGGKAYSTADETSVKSLVDGSSEARAVHDVGVELLMQQSFKEAIQAFDRAIKHDPNFALAYVGRGAAKGSLRQTKAGFADFDKAIQLDPNLDYAYYNRGALHIAEKDFEKGLLDLDKAIEINPSYAKAYSVRSKALKQLGQSLLSEKDSAKACELDRSLC